MGPRRRKEIGMNTLTNIQVLGTRSEPCIQATFPNEEPDQDERTLSFEFRGDVIVVYGYVGEQEVDRRVWSYEGFYEEFILGGFDRPRREEQA